MGVIECLHLGGAVVFLGARRDAFGVSRKGIGDLGDGGGIAIANGAAIGLVGIGSGEEREHDQTGGDIMQPGFLRFTPGWGPRG